MSREGTTSGCQYVRVDGRDAPAGEGTPLVVVERLLAEDLGLDASAVERIGDGAWSECFAFVLDASHLVIRLNHHVDDFEKDRRASAFATPDLPIPRVLDVGRALGGYYAISEHAGGSPLETSGGWDQLVDPVARALESMRVVELAAGSGWGAWDGSGLSSSASWRDFLLGVDVDSPDRRTHGWRDKLHKSPTGTASFREGYRLLEKVATDSVPQSLVHCDLLNGNVHVANGQLTGVFDWGCSIYGDHLYDLAWFEFWAPWLPNIRAGSVRDSLRETWQSVGHNVTQAVERTVACYLHIGLDHLSYNAHLEDWNTLTQVESRMRDVIAAA